MKNICVFCGSNSGNDPEFFESAQLLGKAMAEKNIGLVYGGSNIGLMGAVADSVLAHGGRAYGVLPRFLATKEIAHTSLTDLFYCETMHERKNKMFELSQGFMALPGGFGTLEEIIEILTWRQLGLHKFPVGIANVNGFFNHLEALFDDMERKGLLKSENKKLALFSSSVIELLDRMF